MKPWGIAVMGFCSLVGAAAREPQYVLARPVLLLRDGPSLDAEPLAEIPEGSAVIPEPGGRAVSGRVQGIPGHWRAVTWGSVRGYVFDGFLSPLPAPPRPCAGLRAYAETLGREGALLVEKVRDCQCPDHEVRQRASFAGGVEWVREERYTGVEDLLRLPDIGLPQAWFVARACVPSFPELREARFPAAPYRLAAPAGEPVAVTPGTGRLEVTRNGSEARVQIATEAGTAEIRVWSPAEK